MRRFFILFLLLVCIGMTVFAQIDLQIVARVNLTKSEAITVKQLKTELESLAWQTFTAQYNRVPTSQEIATAIQNTSVANRRQVLDTMINKLLVLQAAERDRVTVTDNELNQAITRLRTQMTQGLGRQPTDAEFALAVKNETGQDLPAFRESLRRDAIAQKYLMAKKQDIFSSVKPPTETEIVNYYNLSKTQFIRPDSVRFSMIQVPYGPDAASKARARTLAERLSRDIGSNPAKFDEAVVNGQSPNSGYQAGDAGYLPRNLQAQQAAGEDFVNTAFSLRQGEVSKLIEGVPGYQIIKITETHSQKALELDDIAELGTRMTVRQFIGAALAQRVEQETIARATQELVRELRVGNPFQVMENFLSF